METETLWIQLKRHKRSLLIFLSLCAVFFLYFMIIDPPLWWYARNEMTSTKKVTSADGNFSIEIPRRWQEDKISTLPLFSEKTYLSVRGEVWLSRTEHSPRRRIMYVDLSIGMTTLPPGSITPSAAELGDELNVRLTALREARAQFIELLKKTMPEAEKLPGASVAKEPSSTTFEVKRIKGYQWAKTRLTIEREVFVFWQTVDDRMNHYIVAFATDNISHYEPIIDNIMKSFSFYNQ